MTTINIKGSINGGNNQFGDNNQQIIVSSQVLNEVREALTAQINENVTNNSEANEYIEYVEILTNESKPEKERKSAARKIGTFIQPILSQLSEMAGAFLRGYNQ